MKKLAWALSFALCLNPYPASAADTQAPVLVDWSLTSTLFDSTGGDASFSTTFIISDDSIIEEPKLLLKSTATNQLTDFAKVKEISKSGKLVKFEAVATIKKGQTSGIWEWVLYPLSDKFGNTSNLFGPESKWKKQVILFDSSFTRAMYNCRGTLDGFNKELSRFYDQRDRYPLSRQDFDILKLNLSLPDKPIAEIICGDATSSDMQFINQDFINRLTNQLNLLTEKADRVAELAAEAEAKAKAEAEAKAKAEAEAKAKAEAEAKAKAKAEAAKKKTTITCIKGKIAKKVTAVNPKCPSGYKKK